MTGRLRDWWAGRTLRWRMIAGVLVLLVVTCAVIGVATTYALRGFLLDRLDQQLADVGPRLALSLEHPGGQAPGEGGGGGDLDDDALRGQEIGTFAARLVGTTVTDTALIRDQGTQVGLSTPTLTASDAARLVELPTRGAPHTVELSTLGSYRVSTVTGADGDVLVAGLPLDSVTATVHRLEAIEVVVFAAALVLAGLSAAGWVGLSLRPLRRVTGTALKVARTPLSAGAVSLPAGLPDANPATEMGQVGAAFNQMLTHVQAALSDRHATEARLRQFIADASHELRTPLAAIRGHAELAVRRRDEALPEDVAHALRRVESEAARMGVLVDDLLLLARLDAGRPLAREEVDLSRLAIDATSDARASGPRHRWLLELPTEPVLVTGDQHRLHQVLANLLANVATHTPAGSTATTRLVTSVPGRPHFVELSVTDDGPGIDAPLREQVFERFVRADASRTRATGSTGLGLAIVAAVVHAHQGTVTVESRPGRTRFQVLLPARMAPSAEFAAPTGAAGSPGRSTT